MVKLSVGYPSEQEEAEILARRRARQQEELNLEQVTHAAELLAMRQAVEGVFIHPDLETYIVKIVQRTRSIQRVAVGASPRASLAFMKLARAWAALQGRNFVLPDDIKHFRRAVLSHRLILEPAHWMSPNITQEIIQEVFAKVAVPVLE